MKVFKQKGFWIGIGVFLLVVVVLLAAIVLEWSLVVTGLGLAVVLLLVGMLVMMRQMKAAQASSGLEAQIMAQAQAQQHTVRADQQAEIARLQADLERAIETLKQSKLAKTGWRPGGGKAALYALPWYLMIGPPGAGKTTAIANSGLNFPVGTDRVRGVGGTRDCDWFFADQAILLDTAGRYVTEHEDADEWLAFLDILKKHRKERPINGVLVGIALDELIGAAPAEIERHADTVRARIDELVQRLGIRFPIYLLFTKSDLMQGFVEFFGEFDRREREAIWGATLELEATHEAGMRGLFEREFDVLTESLSGVRSRRLRRAMPREERKLVYNFPLQFAALRETLGTFIGRLFQPNPYQETPIFRGFYFTSGTQEGIPIDRVIRAIEAEFDLPPEMTPLGAETEAKSYFIKDLFTEVVVPDQYLGRRTSRAATRSRLASAGTSVAALALLALFILGTSQALVRSKLDLNRARDTAAEAALVQWSEDRPSATDLERMAALRTEIEDLDAGIPISLLGLSRRGTVLDPVRDLYRSRARAFVEAYPLPALRRRLALVARDSAASASAYDDLKAYLLLTSEVDRLSEEADAGFLEQHLAEVTYASLYDADSSLVSVPDGLGQHLAAFVGGLASKQVQPFEPQAALVQRTRDLIDEPLSIRGVYERLKSEGNALVPPVRLADAVTVRFQQMFQTGGRTRVPGFFTQRGWREFASPSFEEESEDPSRDDWVLGRTGAEIPAEMQDPAEMQAALEELYFADYTRAWNQFMRNVRYVPFGSPDRAVGYLETLSRLDDSPLLHLLARVTEETTFSGLPGGAVGEEAAGALQRQADRIRRRVSGRQADDLGGGGEGHPVERQFARLHALQADSEPVPELAQAIGAFGQVSSVLDQAASDRTQAAEFAASVIAGNGGDLNGALRQMQGLRNLLDLGVWETLFEEPVYVAWGSILGEAQQHLNERWRDEVRASFQSNLAGRYPFDPDSQQDAPLGDFEEFFRPGDGTFALFYDEVLAPFMTREGRPRMWGEHSIGLSGQAQRAINQARDIGNALFSGGSARLEFELRADQPSAEGAAPMTNQVSINIHGQPDVYLLGSQRWTSFAWPGSPGAHLTVSTRQGNLTKEADGDWAWFRLLQRASFPRASSTEYEVRWPFGEGNVYTLTARYTLRTRSTAFPYNNPVRFFTFAPPATLN